MPCGSACREVELGTALRSVSEEGSFGLRIQPAVYLLVALAGVGLFGPAAALAQTPGQEAGPTATDLDTSRPDPEGVATKISIGVYLVDLSSIDDLKQEFTADLYIVARWRDARLSRPEAASSGLQRTMSLFEIWNPHLDILNRRGSETTLPETVRVDPEGNVEYAQRFRGQFASPMDLRRFPRDRQTLEMKFISLRYGPDELAFEETRMLRHETFSVTGWQIAQPVGGATPLVIPSVSTRAGLTLSLPAKRQGTFYLLTMVLPLTLIALMAWCVFWIDPAWLPSQIAIATSSVFTLIAFRLTLMWSLPKVSYLTIADKFVLAVTLLIFGALGEAVFTGRLAKSGREDLARTVDRWARWLYLSVLAIICLAVLI